MIAWCSILSLKLLTHCSVTAFQKPNTPRLYLAQKALVPLGYDAHRHHDVWRKSPGGTNETGDIIEEMVDNASREERWIFRNIWSGPDQNGIQSRYLCLYLVERFNGKTKYCCNICLGIRGAGGCRKRILCMRGDRVGGESATEAEDGRWLVV
jgi:hypothetical protein